METIAAGGAFASTVAATFETDVVNVAVVAIVVVVGIAVTGGVGGGASNEDSLRVRL